MNIARCAALAGALAVSATLATAPAASAEERTCRGTIGAVTVDNLRVPQGARCTLNGTLVQGSITVGPEAALHAYGVTVVGDVQGEGARNVRVLDGSTVGGSVQVVQGQAARVADSRITGNVLVDENTGRVSVVRNRVGSDIQAFQNTGGVVISGNRVDGNLQCKENVPAPTGTRNVVEGSKEDQCSRM